MRRGPKINNFVSLDASYNPKDVLSVTSAASAKSRHHQKQLSHTAGEEVYGRGVDATSGEKTERIRGDGRTSAGGGATARSGAKTALLSGRMKHGETGGAG